MMVVMIWPKSFIEIATVSVNRNTFRIHFWNTSKDEAKDMMKNYVDTNSN